MFRSGGRLTASLVVVLVVVVLAGCTSAGDAVVPAPTGGPSGTGQAALDAALRDAAWADDVATARRLVAQGADVDAKDETQQSAYLVATSEGYIDLLELTLTAGADVGAARSVAWPRRLPASMMVG